MDKSWMSHSRTSHDFLSGLNAFISHALCTSSKDNKIICACKKCCNRYWLSGPQVFDHIVCHGFLPNYTHWVLHGEGYATTSSVNTGVGEQLDYANGFVGSMLNDIVIGEGIPINGEGTAEGNGYASDFWKLLDKGQLPLFPGCTKHTLLSFILRMFNIKCMGKWSNKSFTWMLELLNEILPEGHCLPSSFYETSKILKCLGLTCERIDACPNDCVLFRNQHANLAHCPICGASRWKASPLTSMHRHKSRSKPIPVKVLRYFPLSPRLQRLYLSSKTAVDMRWHYDKRTRDGCLRHPADSPAWKTFDYVHKDFGSDP